MLRQNKTNQSSHLLTAFFLVFFRIVPPYHRCRLSPSGPALADCPFQRVRKGTHCNQHSKTDFQRCKS